jgi:3-oxoacid CoA-transferase subunit A
MIYLTGDTHGDFKRIKQFCKEQQTSKENDLLIIMGDAGINYYGNTKGDIKLKRTLRNLPIQFFIIRGNHENNPENIPTYTYKEFAGNVVLYEPEFPNLMFALDGRVYRLQDKTIWVMGGAYSVDKIYRLTQGWKWFSDEQPSDTHKLIGLVNLQLRDWKVDYVMTHTCPYNYIPRETFLPFIEQDTVDNTTEKWLQQIEDKIDYLIWFCGHYHTDKWDNKIRFLFKDIIEL